jgi:hypothetical protein
MIRRRLIRLSGILLSAASMALAQQDQPLQQQLQQLKQQYADTTRELEQRIAALEPQISEQEESRSKAKQGTVSAVELAAQERERSSSWRVQSSWGQFSRSVAVGTLLRLAKGGRPVAVMQLSDRRVSEGLPTLVSEKGSLLV